MDIEPTKLSLDITRVLELPLLASFEDENHSSYCISYKGLVECTTVM